MEDKEQGTNLVDDLGIADSGKLLLLFFGASKKDIGLEEEAVDSYAYLLTADNVLKFNYPFQFAPLPHSPLMRGDLNALVQGEFLARGSRIFIGPFGKEWVQQEVSIASDFEEVVGAITKHLAMFAAWSRAQLFNAVYAALAR